MPRNRIANLVGTITGTSLNVSNIFLSSGLNVASQVSAAYTQANSAYAQSNAAYTQANSAYAQANAAYGAANTAQTTAQNAYDQANSAYAQANTATTTAQNAYGQANSAFSAANNRVLKSGDTMTSTLFIAYDNTTFPSAGGGPFLALESTNASSNLAQTAIMFRGTDAGNTARHGGSITFGKEPGWAAGSGDYPGYIGFNTRKSAADGGAHSENMRITSNGKVGIGTSSPEGKLHVVSGVGWFTTHNGTYESAGFGPRPQNDGYCSVKYSWGTTTSGNFWVSDYQSSSWSIQRYVGGSSSGVLFALDSSGNVGIGTSSISGKLQATVTDASTVLKLERTGAGATDITFDFSGANYVQSLSAGAAYIWKEGGAEHMRLDANGNVGIGTNSPTAKLDVRTAAGSAAQFNLYTGNNASTATFSIGQVGSTAWDQVVSAAAGQWSIGVNSGQIAYNIFRSGTSIDYQTWSTGGSERIRVIANGNFGIGTSSPSKRLHVANDSASAEFLLSSTQNVYADFYLNTWALDRALIRAEAANPGSGSGTGSGALSFWTARNPTMTEAMRIDGSGNVGVGTSSPNAIMHIVTANVSAPMLRMQTSGNSQNTALWMEDQDGNVAARAIATMDLSAGLGLFNLYGGAYTVSSASYYGSTRGASRLGLHDGSINFYTANNSGAGQSTGTAVTWYQTLSSSNTDFIVYTNNGTERLRVDANGNVGVGTSSPNFKQEISQGSGSAAPSLRQTPQLVLKGWGGSSTYHSGIGFSMSEHTAGYWGSGIVEIDDTGSYGAALGFYTSTGAASASPSERMRISSSGNVGIGTTSPVANLHVASTGTIIDTPIATITSSATYAENAAGKVIVVDSASNLTVTAAAASVAGFSYTVVRKGSGNVTIANSGTTRLNSASYTSLNVTQYAAATIVYTATNEIVLFGDFV